MFEGADLKNIQFHEGFAFGLFLAATCSALTYAAAKDWKLNQETYSDVSLAIAALGAAALTIQSIRKQMQQERELSAEQSSRKLKADRALLGLALHDLHDIFLRAAQQVVYPNANFELDWERITSSCERIGKCVENSDPESSKSMARLMSWAQVHTARHKQFLESKELLRIASTEDIVVLDGEIVSRAGVAAQLLEFVIICSSGFKYARFDEDHYKTPEVSGADLERGFWTLVSIKIEKHDLWPRIKKTCHDIYT
ncbi:hypothetical protein [Ruegeria arenilitoris]|uniref:hypothetical protein n=1 Tax=Ruegeria arenilitoris TaxID=1173585 RepID=UPI00147C424F|nr:hypothetical protein [Ruegeria arenilitoris]